MNLSAVTVGGQWEVGGGGGGVYFSPMGRHFSNRSFTITAGGREAGEGTTVGCLKRTF